MPMSVPRRLAEAIESWLHFEYCCFEQAFFREFIKVSSRASFKLSSD